MSKKSCACGENLNLGVKRSAVLGESGELKLWNEGVDRPVLALPIPIPL